MRLLALVKWASNAGKVEKCAVSVWLKTKNLMYCRLGLYEGLQNAILTSQ